MEEKTVVLTLTKEVNKKSARRKDGKSFSIHNVIAKSDKTEFPAVMFLDDGETPPYGEPRSFKVKKAINGDEWVLTEVKPKGAFGPVRAGQEIHAASLMVAKDLFIAGKVTSVDGMIATMKKLSEETLAHWRMNR